MKYFVISDVHSNYNYMMTALSSKGFNENDSTHKIVLIGDAFDRGDDPVKMYMYLKDMIEKNKLIWIVGNHEFLLLKRLQERKFNNYNETYETLLKLALNSSGKSNLSDAEIFGEIDKMNLESFMLDNLVPYLETKSYVLAHGFIPTKKNEIVENWRELPLKSWYIHSTKNGVKKVMVDGITIPNKTLICGHTRASYGNVRKDVEPCKWNDKCFDKLQKYKKYKILDDKSNTQNSDNIDMFKPYYGKNVIGIDGCCGETKMVNCIVIEE